MAFRYFVHQHRPERNPMRSLLLLSACCLCLGGLRAQFANGCSTIGGSQYESARAVVQTSDGGYAFAGFTLSFPGGSDQNMYVVKLDATGAVQWNMGYGNTLPGSTEVSYDLVQTADGGYALGGVSGGFGMGLMKLDAAGAPQWSQRYDTYGTDGVDDLYAVLQTPDGGYLLAGTGQVGASPNFLMVVIKTDALGSIEWSKAYEDTFGTQEVYDAVLAVGGGYAICGYHTNITPVFRVLRLDEQGDVLWAKGFGTGNEFANAIAATPDSGFVAVGRTNTYGFANAVDQQDDAFVVKVDKNGSLQWARAFGDTLSEEFLGVVPTSDGGYAMCGQALVPPLGTGSPRIYVAKCDANGQRLWSQRLGPQGSQAWDIVECDDDGLAISGAANVSGVVQCSFMKMEADGTICPDCLPGPYGADSAAALVAVDLTYTLYDSVATSAPYSVNVYPGGTADIECSTTGLEEVHATAPLLTIAPNPATDQCSVSFTGINGVKELLVMDAQGREVLRAPTPGPHYATLSLVGIACGLYTVRTVGAGTKMAGRFVVVR